MGSNADGSLSGLDKAKNDIFGVLDPGGLLVSQEKDTSRPAYEQQLNQYNATNAMGTGNLISAGGFFVPNGAGGGYRYSPLASGMSVPQLMGLNADPNSNLRAQLQQNPFLTAQGPTAQLYANGVAGQNLADQNGTAGALQNASAAAGGIMGAGRVNQGLGNYSALANQGQLDQFGNDMNVIRNSALGRGPSAAENLARAQLDNNIRAQSAMAATARGGNIAAAMRGAQGAGQQMMLQSQAQMAAQRAQEQLNAQQLMTQGNTALTGAQNNLTQSRIAMRGQDIGQAQAAASAAGQVAGQYNDLSRTQASLAAAGLSSIGQGAQTYANQQSNAQTAEQAARNDYANTLLKMYSLQNGMPVNDMGYQTQQRQLDQQQQAADRSAIGGLIGGLSTIL